MDCRRRNPRPTWRWGSGAGFCTATWSAWVEVFPPCCSFCCVLGDGDYVLGGAGELGMLGQKPPGMVTVPGWKWPVVNNILIMGVKWGQRSGRWLVKTCRKLFLNLVWESRMRAASMIFCTATCDRRIELISSSASGMVAILNTSGWRS